MSDLVHPPETDLLAPLPAPGETWDPYLIHTHYFGFHVPEAALGGFLYIRYQPAFPLGLGGVVLYQGTDNLMLGEALFVDYVNSGPWPAADGNGFELANGLRFAFPEPGRRAEITYRAADGTAALELEATAVTPLAARGHVLPGEEHHVGQQPGGSEQFMRYTGEVTVRGERFEVDCHAPRDRSWRQVRGEDRGANVYPPISWTPVYFGPDLAFNQVGVEDPETAPWRGAYDLPDGGPHHHFAWVSRDGDVREVTEVRRVVTRYHPLLPAPLDMEIEATDEAGDTYSLRGEAIGFCPLPGWPNMSAFETLLRWQDGEGRVGHGPAQSVVGDRAARALKARRAVVVD